MWWKKKPLSLRSICLCESPTRQVKQLFNPVWHILPVFQRHLDQVQPSDISGIMTTRKKKKLYSCFPPMKKPSPSTWSKSRNWALIDADSDTWATDDHRKLCVLFLSRIYWQSTIWVQEFNSQSVNPSPPHMCVFLEFPAVIRCNS